MQGLEVYEREAVQRAARAERALLRVQRLKRYGLPRVWVMLAMKDEDGNVLWHEPA